jgi:hypothetical protein
MLIPRHPEVAYATGGVLQCLEGVCEGKNGVEATRSHCAQTAGAESRVRSAGDEIQTVSCEARYVRRRPGRAQQSSVRVRNDREHGEVRR